VDVAKISEELEKEIKRSQVKVTGKSRSSAHSFWRWADLRQTKITMIPVDSGPGHFLIRSDAQNVQW